MCYKSVLQYRCYVVVQAQGDHAMQALNNNATVSRSIYPKTQNILQADIGNHSLILLQTTEYYKRELEMNPYQTLDVDPATRRLLDFS